MEGYAIDSKTQEMLNADQDKVGHVLSQNGYQYIQCFQWFALKIKILWMTPLFWNARIPLVFTLNNVSNYKANFTITKSGVKQKVWILK